MADHAARLCRFLFEEKPSPSDLTPRLRSDDSLRQGLERFYFILKSAISPIESEDGGGGRMVRFQAWSDSQLQSVVSVAQAIAALTRSLSVDQIEPLLLVIIQELLQFAVQFLEKSDLGGDDLSTQINVLTILEIACLDGMDMLTDTIPAGFEKSIGELCQGSSCDHGDIQFASLIRCNFQGGRCSNEKMPVDRLFVTLASECVQSDCQASGFGKPNIHQDVGNMISVSRHLLAIHFECISCLIKICSELIQLPDTFDEKIAVTLSSKRLPLCLRILKLLGSLSKDAQCFKNDASLLPAVALFGNTLPMLFRPNFRFSDNAAADGTFESLALSLSEEFLCLVRIIYANRSVSQNIQACLAACMVSSLDSSVWQYDRTSPDVKPPLVYFPRTVVYMVGLIQELKRQAHQIPDLRVFGTEINGGPDGLLFDSASCKAHDRKVPLLNYFTVDELMRIIFPSSIPWLDNLVNLVCFLHSEGLKSRPKVERSHSIVGKAYSFAEVESQISHEDEAIFGNLFSEASRSLGSTDLYDKAPATSSCNLLMQAARELLSFLNGSIFHHEWVSSIYDDVCKRINQNHIDVFLNVLCCQESDFEDKKSDGVSALHEEGGKAENIFVICFELLRNLLRSHALSDFLQEYLVQRILSVENGVLIYTDQTLTLLAHVLLCKPGLAGAPLRERIFEEFLCFVKEKAKIVCSKGLILKDLMGTLPSLFHVEIILTAFHLSTEGEKSKLVNQVVSSLVKIDTPSVDCDVTQLSCWALLISRLLVLLHHMVSHPCTCPTALLLDLQSRLREVPSGEPHAQSSLCVKFPSWISTIMKDIFASAVEEEPNIRNLISQLVDIIPNPSAVQREKVSSAIQCLSWRDAFATFARVLELWKGKKAAAVEDLIVERYFFMLCWHIAFVCSPTDHSLVCADSQKLDLSAGFFFHISHSLLGQYGVGEGIDWKSILLGVLSCICELPRSEEIENLGWDFLRNGSWLCLVLCFVNAGIWGYCKKGTLLETRPLCSEGMLGDHEFVEVAKGLISRLIEGGEVAGLLSMLSSLLKTYLQVYSKAFVVTVSVGQNHRSGFSPLLLLKHSEFGTSMQDEFLEKYGSDVHQLKYVLDLTKLDGAIEKRGLGMLSMVPWESMVHGFPSHVHASSAFLVSCIFGIKTIILTINGLFRMESIRSNPIVEPEVLCDILSSVMVVKFDRIFESLHGICGEIYQNICAILEMPDLAELFLLKQMEGFVREFIGGDGGESSILEWGITKIVDIVNNMKKDPSKSVILKFNHRKDDSRTWIKESYQLQPDDLSVMVDALDNCYAEAVNVKVLNLFSDLSSEQLWPDLREGVRQKFLDMDVYNLSCWLEKRLLGLVVEESDGKKNAKGNSVSFREAAMDFVNKLVSLPSDSRSRDLCNHFFDAMLICLDSAFLLFDSSTAKSYFQFVAQFSREESMLKLLLNKTLMLMVKLAGSEHMLPGLKFLFGVVGTMLSDCGSSKSTSDKSFGKSLSSSKSSLSSSLSSRSAGSHKNSQNILVPVDQEGGSLSLECDVTSLDEDEDDGTSDGEIASVDKDEEEDANSERALASKVCTFTSSGSNFMEQHWYFCYTCDLTVSKGCCSVCAKVCHRGHRVVYSRSSRFFCDCGAGGVRGSSCQCLKPRKYTGGGAAPSRDASHFPSFLPFPEEADQLQESDSDLDEDVTVDADNFLGLSFPKEIQERISVLLKELDVEGRVLELCSSLLPSITSRRESNLSEDKKLNLGKDKMLSYGLDLLQLKKAYKSGSLDLKVKADYANSKELKSLLVSGSVVKSLLSVSIRGRLAVGEGDKVAIFDVGQLIGQATIAPVTADKTNVKPLSRNIVRFEIVHLAFNQVVENYLAVAGLEDCQVLTVSPRGEVTDRLAIELALQGAYIRCISWVPGSQVHLMVVTNRFVKIYDLSQDNISPMHYITLQDDMIVDSTLFVVSQGKCFLLVLSEQGKLYRFQLSLDGNVGATPLKEIIQVKNGQTHAKGSSLYFSSTYRILFLSYQDGTSLVGQLSADATSLTEISYIYEEEPDGKFRPAGLHRWKELPGSSGLFVSFANMRPNNALAVSMGSDELGVQNLRHPVGSATPLVGVTAYKPLSKDYVHCLVLHDDGSLQIYSHVPKGDEAASMTAEKVRKIGFDILNNKTYGGTKPEFPLDFFEKTVCITSDVKLSGDAIRDGDSEGVKQSLASEDGFIESPSPAGFKITVSNPNPDIIMVGIRIHVGNTSASHIPSEVTIFKRVIKLDEGMRSWYDIPFTVAESLLADEEFSIMVGPTFNGTTSPRIDSLEVYSRAKDEFGWKEKLDAVLDMEARVLGSKSLLAGSKKKSQSSGSIQEQVVADGLKLLSLLYSLCRPQQEVDPSDLRCKQLLEAIFESDREPLMQAAACRVLQTVFPKREMYYQVKDTMRLRGVVKATVVLSSKLVVGSTGGWIIEEFNAQMRAVSKIAMNRQCNLSYFLESNGSEVVDGLMQVLWGILELGLPDTQTMNNIVISAVEFIYSYAECLASHGNDPGGRSVAHAVRLLKKLLFFPNEAVQTSSSLAISSRLLQVPFPKQTMLAADDAVENVTSSSVPVRTGGGNPQVIIDDDTVTSTVQYCCDGCSTVPILRRRWHCTVCPDFDLCEACYEVLDADRLPPPHTRDHPMTAIPIEVESFGADGSEIHFTSDEVGGSNIMPVKAGGTAQGSTPSIHVLEPGESEGFSASLTDQVSISASKRAVNSLILSELLGQLKGWLETTSGVQAVPVMQLFYRLSSAIGGPFTDSSKLEDIDLEKLIKWFLDEINLSKPFMARTRTTFGEVAILVFMFFTLMLRNWHQPGSDSAVTKTGGGLDGHDRRAAQTSVSVSSQSSLDAQERNDFASQLLRAGNYLRNQAFINYLMNILQQLVQVFKSPASGLANSQGLNVVPGCGALLSIRRDLPAGNYSPFFSDSYAKAHRADLFMDYHRLLLENVFRLVYSLVRPEKQEKGGEKEKVYKALSGKDLKLDGYQDVLCSYINSPNTTFIRRYARRLFLHVCGSKTQYYSVRDSWQFSNEVKRLYKHVEKSGGLQNRLPYERSVKIVKSLSTMAEVAAARPRNWQKYCLRHVDFLPFLLNGVFYLAEESVIQTLKLLGLAFYTGKDVSSLSLRSDVGDAGTGQNRSGLQSTNSKKKRKGEDGSDSGLEKSYVDMDGVADIFIDKSGDVLRQFIDVFLLEWNSSSVRAEAKCVLYGLWHHGRQSLKETMLTALLHKMKTLPMYGQNIIEYTELFTWLLGKVPDNNSKQLSPELVEQCLTPEVIRCIFETLHTQNELLANHPNSRIYNTLSNLVEFDGYYLESEPCVGCSSPEVPYSRMKLESLKSETKFTDNRIIVKCTGSYTIQSVTMNVHDARKSKSVKVLNLYYNNRPVSDLSELKNNWSLWKRAKSCHLNFNQTELKVEFPIPITACNFMIELDSFYENLQALSLEPLQCPRCSRPVTDKHGICSNCHENAYQCRQCRNINYENLDSFLCNECGYSKYGRFEFNFLAKPSFTFDEMENDDDMRKGLAAIESESENAHRRYQQLLNFKKPLLKIVSSIGESDLDSQQKDTVQQMMASLPGSCKINRKIALLGVLYGEKCKAAFDSVSKSVQTLQGLRRVLLNYLHQKNLDNSSDASRLVVSRSPNNCYGCATTFVTQCLEILQVLSRYPSSKKQLAAAGIFSELFENNIHQGPKAARAQARAVLCAFSEGDINAVNELNSLIQRKVMYCLEHHRSMDIALATKEEILLLSEVCSMTDEFWELRLRVVFQMLFSSIKLGAKHPAISENVILPCLRIISQACTPPKPDVAGKEQGTGKAASATQPKDENNAGEKNLDFSHKTQDVQLVSYWEWEKGASYVDFVRRQYKLSQAIKGVGQRSRSHKPDYLALKYALRWKRRACKTAKGGLQVFELGSWVTELVLSACSQSIRSEMCMLINLLCLQSSSRRYRLLNLLMGLLPATLSAGESGAEYFDLLFKMIDSEDARLFLTVRGCLTTICKLITQEVGNVESLERSLHIDISQGFVLHKLIELLGKFLEVPNIRTRFMRDNLLSEILEALIVIRGLIVQKTKLITDCNKLLNDLLDTLLHESSENKRQFIHACICGLQTHGKERKRRNSLFILEQLCNLICPSKPEAVYMLILNKAHTQEEFIRGSMTKNPYSSAEIGPLMRDVKNKICQQLDLLGLLEDDYGMELLVAGNIISLDLSIAQVYEHVWRKSNSQSSSGLPYSALMASNASNTATSTKDCPPMTVTYRLQGLDGEATEPMIKELEEDREETQDPEVEFAIAGAVRECGGLEILLNMIQCLQDDFRSNQEELVAVLNLLMHCCKIKENRRALLRLGALTLLLETARRAFYVDKVEPAEGILLIVESLTLEANESDSISITQSVLTVTSEDTGAGEKAKKIVLMFLERLSHPVGIKKSNKQQRNTEMVARILPYLTYGEPAAMHALIQHFSPYLEDWGKFDRLQKQHEENPKDENIAQEAAKERFTVENFVRVSESLKTSSCGERLKDIVLEKGITGVAVQYLKESFAMTAQAGFKSSEEWLSALKLPSIPHILSMLRGLSTGHLPTQKCIDEGGILQSLHALEGVSGENEIGARAENLLDTLADKEGNGDGFLGEKVQALRSATRDEMRRLALRKREKMLQGLGMRQEHSSKGGERIVVAQPLLEGFEDVEEEEDGLACMVCREGYSLRPADLLGVYSYSKRVNLGVGTSGNARGECVYTTVSYFNIIHFQCHQEAKRADSALRNPKKEWEGATLRNNESLCNSLFPIRGPSVPLAQYVRYVDQFWDNLNALGRADGGRLRLLTYDIVLMLARFATGASFSADSRGGGRESNSKFLPFMIQMARHLLDQGNSSQRRSMASSVSSYINSSASDSRPPSPGSPQQPSAGTEETVQFMMVNSLLSESYESWLQHRCAFLQRGIYHTYMQHTHGRSTSRATEKTDSAESSSGSPDSPDDLLLVIRPMLVYTGLIEQLQQFFKKKKSTTAVGSSSSPSSSSEPGGEDDSSLEAWEIVMKERLLNMKEMLGFSKELLSWLDDMDSATDLQEAFDIVGVLADVLSGGFKKCEDFVHATINGGKS